MLKVFDFIILSSFLFIFVSCGNSSRKTTLDIDPVQNDLDIVTDLDEDSNNNDSDIEEIEADVLDNDSVTDDDSEEITPDTITDIDTELPDVDNGECSSGEQRTCYTGTAETKDIGACHGGMEECVNGSWNGVCLNEQLPTDEICDEIDNDCDGTVDNGFDLTSDINNCNMCNNICSARNSYAGCDDGMCRFGCLDNYFNTDSDEYNGCEAGCLAPEETSLASTTSILSSDYLYLNDGFGNYVIVYSGLSADSTKKGIFLTKYDKNNNVVAGFDHVLLVEGDNNTEIPFVAVGFANKKYYVAWVNRFVSQNKEYLMYKAYDNTLTELDSFVNAALNVKELGDAGSAKSLAVSKEQSSSKLSVAVLVDTSVFTTYIDTSDNLYSETFKEIDSVYNENIFATNDDSAVTALVCKKLTDSSYLDLLVGLHKSTSTTNENVDSFSSSSTCGTDSNFGDISTYAMTKYSTNNYAVAYRNTRKNLLVSFYSRELTTKGGELITIERAGSQEFYNLTSDNERIVNVNIYVSSDPYFIATYIVKSGENYNYYYFMFKKAAFGATMIGSPVKYFTTTATPKKTFGKYDDSTIYLLEWYETVQLEKKIDISTMKSCTVE